MPSRSHAAIALFGLALALAACSPTPGPATRNELPAPEGFAGLSSLEQAAEVRSAREAELAERRSTTPEELERQCRFESSISTPPPNGKVALTFDDGPDASATETILAVLKKYHIHATFFVIGYRAEARPDLIRKVQDEGHLIVANHSWSHPDFHALSVTAQAEQFSRTDAAFGADFNPKFFRYPYGNSSCETNDLVHSKGYRIVGWHVDSCDWAFNATGSVSQKEADSCVVSPGNVGDYVGHVVSSVQLHKGGIVLMHEIQPITPRNLEVIITRILAGGFTFGSLDDADFASSTR